MRLLEFLYLDPGGPPQPDHGSNWHMDRPEPNQQVADQEPLRRGDHFAYLNGRGVHFYRNFYDQDTAIRYRHFLSESFRRNPIDMIERLDEVLKKGVQSRSAGDNRAIKALETGKYPGKSEDGKGFCFHWADGRGICGFKFRNDALRWAKQEPRDIVRFWYGEPVHGNKKFRFKVRERYKADESKLTRQEVARFGTRTSKRKLSKKGASANAVREAERYNRASETLRHDALSVTRRTGPIKLSDLLRARERHQERRDA